MTVPQARADLIALRRLVLVVAIAAIHWAALGGLEWDLTILLAVVANGFVHFPRCPVVHFLIHLRFRLTRSNFLL